MLEDTGQAMGSNEYVLRSKYGKYRGWSTRTLRETHSTETQRHRHTHSKPPEASGMRGMCWLGNGGVLYKQERERAETVQV